MALNINARWHPPVDLKLVSKWRLNFLRDEMDKVPSTPGIYAFLRLYGKNTIDCIYVGRSKNVRFRLKRHLKYSKKLLAALKQAGTDKRIFVACTVPPTKSSKKLNQMLSVLEYGVIEFAVRDGHELFNTHGTKRPCHRIVFSRNRITEQVTPRKLIIPVRKA